MRNSSFLNSTCDTEENKGQRHVTLPFLKNQHVTLGTPHQGPQASPIRKIPTGLQKEALIDLLSFPESGTCALCTQGRPRLLHSHTSQYKDRKRREKRRETKNKTRKPLTPAPSVGVSFVGALHGGTHKIDR